MHYWKDLLIIHVLLKFPIMIEKKEVNWVTIPFFKSTDLPTSLCLENSVFKLLFFNKIFVGGGDGEELGATENDDDNRGDNEPLREQASRFTI